jgi:NTE family protein
MRYQNRRHPITSVAVAALLFTQMVVFQQPCRAEADKQNLSQSLQGKRPKIGLALGGGGIRGAAHIGVLRVLEREGIKVDCIAGTSIGAIVGGLYSAGLSLDDIEDMVARKSLKKAYYTVPLWFRVVLVPFFMVPHLIGENYDGLYKGNRFASFLNKHVGENNQSIENLKIPFCAIASSLTDREAHAIKSGNFGKALQASSAIPVLRRPVEIGNDLYIDGGIINNLPIEECRKMGADVVIAVSLNVEDDPADCQTNKDFKQFKKIGSIGNRVINMILCHVDKDQIRDADVLITPSVNEIRFLSVKEKDAYKAIAAGEVAAKAAMGQVRDKIAASQKSSDANDETRSQNKPLLIKDEQNLSSASENN